jgi:hypothetical protein
MTTQTFFALFWGWLTVIVTAMFFIRPKALHDVKRLIVENRAFGPSYGYLIVQVHPDRTRRRWRPCGLDARRHLRLIHSDRRETCHAGC